MSSTADSVTFRLPLSVPKRFRIAAPQLPSLPTIFLLHYPTPRFAPTPKLPKTEDVRHQAAAPLHKSTYSWVQVDNPWPTKTHSSRDLPAA